MTTPCECPLAGWCERHKVSKGSNWHKLCQTRDNYRQAWDEGRGPGQTKVVEEREERRKRVLERVAYSQRLRGWVTWFKQPTDEGIGDTLARVIKLSGKRAIKKELCCMQRQCGCKVKDATAELNKQYPYEPARGPGDA
jgi:hypothetical protein